MNYEQSWNNLKKALWVYWFAIETNDIDSGEMADSIVGIMNGLEKGSIKDDHMEIVNIIYNTVNKKEDK